MIGGGLGKPMGIGGLGWVTICNLIGWKMIFFLHSSFAAASLACVCSGVPAAMYVKCGL